MRGRNTSIAILCLVALLLCACGGKGPQRPSQRKGQAPKQDTTQLALMELNMQLAQAADAEVLRAVQAQDESYALYDGQTWVHVISTGDTGRPALQPGEQCTMHMRTYSLDGRLLVDSESTYAVGKNELPPCIDLIAGEFHHGAQLKLYAPWYTAYGLQGTDHIPPYENVIIELDIR